MQDLVSTVVLMCAAVASLALGVILAFLACRAGFFLLRMQSPQAPAAPVRSNPHTSEA